jgi:quercetin dioxygenase-like cupin family protein
MGEQIPTPDPQLPVYAKTADEWNAVQPTGKAGSSGSSKVQEVTLLGDPARPGLYVQLLKVAPHAEIAAHHHAGDRSATVLQGTWHFGFGDEFDRSMLRTLPAESIYTEPSGVNHFAATGDQPVIVQITGSGPTDTVYADPSLDPRNTSSNR